MIHKHSVSIAFLCSIFLSFNAHAIRSTIDIMEQSSSGKTLRIQGDSLRELRLGEAIYFIYQGKKISDGRVLQINGDRAVVSIFNNNNVFTTGGNDFEIIYGLPHDEAPNLPDYVANRDEATPNPSNERFFTADGKELDTTPELDDQEYTPETTLRPKLPEKSLFRTHNLTVGLSLFRNRALPSANGGSGTDLTATYTTYQGYTFRYAYNHRTHFWLKMPTSIILSYEFSVGLYNFIHTFPAGNVNEIRVMPISASMRYMFEASKMFRIYPYVGYQTNIVSADGANLGDITTLARSKLFGGLGAQLAMSESIDTRLEAGTDGVTFGLVVKF